MLKTGLSRQNNFNTLIRTSSFIKINPNQIVKQLNVQIIKKFNIEARQITKQKQLKWLKYSIGLGLIGVGVSHIYQQQKIVRGLDFHNQEQQSPRNLLVENLTIIQEGSQTVWGNIKERVGIFLRMIRLTLYYFPTFIVLPLYWWNPEKYEPWLLNALEFGIKNSGSVIIKLAQYGSHRPDIFNENFIKKFAHLRVDAPQHSFSETKKILIQNKLWGEIEDLAIKPIASGVIGQVYEAKYKGEKVALKIRHPEVMQKIKQDLKIVFGISQALSAFPMFTHLQMPLTIHDFMKVLIDQTDFRLEKLHLDKFNENFNMMKDQVDFPKGIYSSQDVLIESFIEKGESISDFMKRGKEGQNKKLAKLGVNCIYKMVIYDNFVHADCHGGNIFVQKIEKGEEKERSTFQPYINSFNRQVYNLVNKAQFGIFNGAMMIYNQYNQVGSGTQGVDQLKKDYQEMMMVNDSDEFGFEDDKEQYQMVMLDTGMVTNLSHDNHINLMRLLMSVVIKDEKDCCNAVRKIALGVDEVQLKKFEVIMKPTFQALKDTPLNQVNIGTIVQNIIFSAQKCQIKFDGNMATLLQNIIVLEGLARQLDPNINIIGQAIPFLVNPTIIQKLLLQ